MRLFLGLFLVSQAFAQGPLATRLSKYILTVSDLEKTYNFYHSAFGVEKMPNSEIRPPQAGAGANQITGSPQESSFRNLNTKIPGTDFTFEFIELTGLPRTPRKPRLQDPGAALLILTVRDINTALDSAKKAGAQVLTLGGAPLTTSKKSKAVFVSDLDGFYVELIQVDPAPASTAPAGSVVLGASWASTVEDADVSASFYRDKFGMEASVREWRKDSSLIKLSGLTKGQIRYATVRVPGQPEVWEFFEFKDVDRKPVNFAVPDPGSLQLGFRVRDIDQAVAAFKSAGGQIVSRGGEIIRRPNGAVALVREPDGVYLEVVQ